MASKDAKAILETKLEELEEAKKLIESGIALKTYLKFSDEILIEVDKNYALEYIKTKIAALKAALKQTS